MAAKWSGPRSVGQRVALDSSGVVSVEIDAVDGDGDGDGDGDSSRGHRQGQDSSSRSPRSPTGQTTPHVIVRPGKEVGFHG